MKIGIPLRALGLALLPFSLFACATQVVVFESPKGARVEFEQESGTIPFVTELKTNKQHWISISFHEDPLLEAGFSREEIDNARSIRGLRFDGVLAVWKGKISSAFKLTNEQVRAVLLENKVVDWKYFDERERLILSFEGYPAGAHRKRTRGPRRQSTRKDPQDETGPPGGAEELRKRSVLKSRMILSSEVGLCLPLQYDIAEGAGTGVNWGVSFNFFLNKFLLFFKGEYTYVGAPSNPSGDYQRYYKSTTMNVGIGYDFFRDLFYSAKVYDMHLYAYVTFGGGQAEFVRTDWPSGYRRRDEKDWVFPNGTGFFLAKRLASVVYGFAKVELQINFNSNLQLQFNSELGLGVALY
ncbi:MAG: hypothetical protein ACYS47_17675 [Planctomycetota bacterium]